jgi:hypothetical protein
VRIYKKQIERITIIFSNDDEDRKRAFDYCLNNNYHITRSGPKRISYGKYDITKGKIVAERERPNTELEQTAPAATHSEQESTNRAAAQL